LMRLSKGKQIHLSFRAWRSVPFRVISPARRIAAKSPRRLCKTAKTGRPCPCPLP